MTSGEGENPDQIPNRENTGETSAVISDQGGIPGQRKEVDVNDYSKAAAVGQILKDMEFPADKKEIIEYADRAKPQCEEILQYLRKIQDREYRNVSEVAEAAGLVRK